MVHMWFAMQIILVLFMTLWAANVEEPVVSARVPPHAYRLSECHLDDSSHSRVHACTRAYARTRPPLKGGKRYALRRTQGTSSDVTDA